MITQLVTSSNVRPQPLQISSPFVVEQIAIQGVSRIATLAPTRKAKTEIEAIAFVALLLFPQCPCQKLNDL